ncbi:type II toxin-antitoxin system RelE/ParE family toxin [Pseudomonas congelans]|nr:type II toxin-antitoxin system RelE/ParE family toxin [Pseudomonas congelans]PBP95781.1 proteic killer protein [Pseudomonas congelans]PBQ06658.1 proteic killer protein [Pseudomonas congelans]PBQ15484.1 proteic killer protein [Pseudomonas congelans]
MIVSFKCMHTRSLFFHGNTRLWPSIKSVAERKLAMLDAATSTLDLRSQPGNRLEALDGSRSGQYSIHINAQFRICFVWGTNGPEDVEIIDYH